ncbi:MAG: antibiotic biosynthesis monooxygenase [Planctomycetota bacterium]
MIARIWHGVTPEAKADEYFGFCSQTGVVDLQATDGNREVYVLRRVENGRAHFLFVSLWESLDAIRAFAGPDVEKPRYYSRDEEFLEELEPTVRHYEVMTHP